MAPCAEAMSIDSASAMASCMRSHGCSLGGKNAGTISCRRGSFTDHPGQHPGDRLIRGKMTRQPPPGHRSTANRFVPGVLLHS